MIITIDEVVTKTDIRRGRGQIYINMYVLISRGNVDRYIKSI